MSGKARVIALVSAVLVLLGVIIAIVSGNSERTFTCDELSITVNGGFTEEADTLKHMNGLSLPEMALVKGSESVYVDNSGKDGFDSIGEYAEAMRDSNADSFDTVSDVLDSDGVMYIELTSKYLDENQRETSKTSKALLAFYENGDKFWTVQISGPESSYASRKNAYLRWARSVTFSK